MGMSVLNGGSSVSSAIFNVCCKLFCGTRRYFVTEKTVAGIVKGIREVVGRFTQQTLIKIREKYSSAELR